MRRHVYFKNMEGGKCESCEALLHEWQERCRDCGVGVTPVNQEEEERKKSYLRWPSLGALLWTQGFSFGARLYILFIMSLIPVVGFAALGVAFLFGRKRSWKYGQWDSWQEFTQRMRLLDMLGAAWVAILITVYFFFRSRSGA